MFCNIESGNEFDYNQSPNGLIADELCMEKKKYRVILYPAIGLFLIFCLWHGKFFANCWLLLTERDNFIPAESSVFTFEPYVMSHNSEDWWIYARDKKNYYYFFHDQYPNTYFYIDRYNKCPKFNKYNVNTWCEGERKVGKR